MGIGLYGIDAVCMALLAVSADRWEGTSRAKGIDAAVMIIQLVTLSGEWSVVEKLPPQTREGLWDGLC